MNRCVKRVQIDIENTATVITNTEKTKRIM